MKVLSLFDGMSCGQLALKNLGIPVEAYFASEIDKHAIKITQKNFPDTIQVGDVKKISFKDGILKTEIGEFNVGEIDLLLGGSPCQNLSRTVINNHKHNQGLEGKKSKLFFDYYRLLNEIDPKYFLYENVGTMKEEDKDTISDYLKSKCYEINSSGFSAQDRNRYYWTDIEVNSDYTKNGSVLNDILEPAETIPDKYWYDDDMLLNVNTDYKVCAKLNVKGHDILKRVYNPEYKSPTLTAVTGGNHQKKVFQNGRARKLLPIEYERLQKVPDNYTQGVSDTQRWCMLGNGWTVDVITHIFKGIKYESR